MELESINQDNLREIRTKLNKDRLEKRIRKAMTRKRLDAILLTNLDNIRYASGFTGSTATVIITQERAIILVDSRYTLQARRECSNFEVIQYSGDVWKFASSLINELEPTRLGFGANHITYANHRRLRAWVSKSTRLIATLRFIEDIRMVKDIDEIARIRRACALADECFSHIIKWVKPGITEREVALEIDTYIRSHGGEREAFDTIVAAGPSAALPHNQPGFVVLQTGQMLKMDFGARLDGYNSDITRTIFLGKPDDKQREVYDTVLEAQLRAISEIRPGKTGREIDSVARDYIASKGYGENFGHGLGHSLGLSVHDGPGFSPASDIVLEPGMVITVEPGIYIEGWGGVRIEDDILVTDTGVEVLTASTKNIVVV